MPATSNSGDRFGPDGEPQGAPDAVHDRAAMDRVDPDVISDPGLEGGVDAPNEEPEESATET